MRLMLLGAGGAASHNDVGFLKVSGRPAPNVCVFARFLFCPRFCSLFLTCCLRSPVARRSSSRWTFFLSATASARLFAWAPRDVPRSATSTDPGERVLRTLSFGRRRLCPRSRTWFSDGSVLFSSFLSHVKGDVCWRFGEYTTIPRRYRYWVQSYRDDFGFLRQCRERRVPSTA